MLDRIVAKLIAPLLAPLRAEHAKDIATLRQDHAKALADATAVITQGLSDLLRQEVTPRAEHERHRAELISVANAARSKAEAANVAAITAQKELEAARLEVATVRRDINRALNGIAALKLAAVRPEIGETPTLESLTKRMGDLESITISRSSLDGRVPAGLAPAPNSRNGNVIADVRTHQFGNRVSM
jgi:hypothetical protein